MKTYHFLGWVALSLAISCTREAESPPDAPPSGQHTFNISLKEATKTELGEISDGRCPTIWSAGDRVSVGGVLSEPLSAEEAGGVVAPFRINGALTAPYNFLCPGSDSPDSYSLPATQHYIEGSYDPAGVPLYAGTYDIENVSLRHTSAVLEVKLTGDVKVRRISVMAAGGEYISGKMVFGKDSEGRFDGTFSIPDGSSGLTLDCGEEGVQLGFEPVAFHFAIPGGNYKSGFYFIVYSTDGEIMRLEYDPGEIAAASLIRFPERNFEADGDFVIIASEEDMMAFMSSHSMDAYLIVSDLDMSGYEWEPFNFNYTLDGGGHTVKGLNSPMFKEVKGTLKNLVFDSEFDYSLNSSTVFGGTIGVVARKIIGATIENCTVRGKYRFGPGTTETKTSTVYVGGFSGTAESNAVVKNCVMEADLSVTSDVTIDVDTYVGGLFGYANTLSELENNVNSGKLTVSVRVPSTYKSSGVSVGGIAGRIASTNCSGNVNKGTILYDGVWQNSVRIGGVSGYLTGTGTLRGDRNEGTVIAAPRNAETTNSRYGGVGGVYGNVTSGTVQIYDAVNSESAVVRYEPDSAPSYSFCVGGIVYSIDHKSTVASGLVNKGKIYVNGSDNALTSNRRGVHVGGIAGTSITQNLSNSVFDGEMDVTVLSAVQNGIGGIVGFFGNTDNSGLTDGMITGCRTTASSSIIIRRRYPSKPVFGGMIAGLIRNCSGGIFSCRTEGRLENIGLLDYGSSTTDIHGFGGIAGRANATTDQTFKIHDCESSASLTFKEMKGSSRVCVGGILGISDAFGLEVENCASSSDILFSGRGDDTCLGGIAGRLFNGKTTMAATVSGDDFSGSIHLSEDGTLSRRPVAGGIVGFAGGEDDAHRLTLNMTDCHNTGSISRSVTGITEMIGSANSSESFAGGVLGSAGLRQVWETGDIVNGERVVNISVEVVATSSVDAVLDGCTNSGRVAFNPTGGIEISPNFTITGGIVGGASPKNGSLLIKDCVNSGAVASDSGTSGGIVGHLYTKTTVRGCTNNGNVFEPDASAPVGTGTGYVIAGGLVGAVNSLAEDSLVEDCWNSGDVAASAFSAMNIPSAGGLVGYYRISGVFTHCKNSGHVRNHPLSGSADMSGYFSGDGSSGTFSECGAGGWVARGGSWSAPDDSWKDRAFAGGAPGMSLPGCVAWDNVSKLPWEE